MNANLTDITLIVDRSGSMEQIRADAEGGVNSFIERQAKEPGDALLTLIQFDTQYEFVHRGVDIKGVRKYILQPRGATALLDAIGRGINETGARLAAMREEDRPALVVFVVMTDGLENSSHEFTKPKIKEMIEHQRSVYNWHFIFLGADQDAFTEAESMGMAQVSALAFEANLIADAMCLVDGRVNRMRRQAAAGMPIESGFSDSEREALKRD